MNQYLDKFLIICQVERGLSKNTVSSYKTDLVDFINFNKTSEINKKTIRSYLENLYLKQIKRSSYLRKLSSLNQFMQFLVEEKVLIENPIVDIKRPAKEKTLPKCLKPAEIEILIETAKKDNKFGIRMALIIDFLYASGMRISELLTLKMNDIKNAEKLIMIKGKGNKERLVPLRKKTFELLAEYLIVRKDFVSSLAGDKYLFCSRSGTGHLTREMVGMELKKVARLANIDETRVSPHVLRHSFATNLVNKKINLRVVQELLGHSDISTTEIYIDTMDSEIIDFVKEHHPMSN